MRVPGAVLLAGVSLAWSVALAADDHLLAGARFFREGRYQDAYVEFSVAARLGEAEDAGWYAAAALVKLDRAEEALEAFAAAAAAAPAAEDALLDYYRALACYKARLYACARTLLDGVEKRGGPRIAGQAEKLRRSIEPLLASEPGTSTLDWYHARSAEALRAGRAILGAAYLQEASALAELRADRYRKGEAAAGIAAARKLQQQGGRP